MSSGIIDLPVWLDTPAGRSLRTWETAAYEQAVANVFGYHALQLGLPHIDTLRANRMPHRWLAALDGRDPRHPETPRPDLQTHVAALPFAAASLDLITLPHALDSHPHPHATLREVARVLVPEGRVVISGFNPSSLWGWRHRRDRLVRLWRSTPGFLPADISPIGLGRLRDWLHLLDFEVEVEHFGCYQPAWSTERWLARTEWMNRLGPQSWPILGSVYLVVAVKRVHGMHLLGASWKRPVARAAVAVPLARRQTTPIPCRAAPERECELESH